MCRVSNGTTWKSSSVNKIMLISCKCCETEMERERSERMAVLVESEKTDQIAELIHK
jgi:hypothetical protein